MNKPSGNASLANRLEYERAGPPSARPHVLIARDLLVMLLKLIGLLVVVSGLWNVLTDLLDTYLSWSRGVLVFSTGGPDWIRICFDAVVAELDTFVIGIAMVVLADLVVRWLLPRR